MSLVFTLNFTIFTSGYIEDYYDKLYAIVLEDGIRHCH